MKVVSVQAGYMSVLAKLKVVETSHSLLVCEPCYLVAAEKGGKLHVWVMNTTWRYLFFDYLFIFVYLSIWFFLAEGFLITFL